MPKGVYSGKDCLIPLQFFSGIAECPSDFFWEGFSENLFECGSLYLGVQKITMFDTLAIFFWEGLLNALAIFSGKDC